MYGIDLSVIAPWGNNHEYQEYVFSIYHTEIGFEQLEKINQLFRPDRMFVNMDRDQRASGERTLSLLFRENQVLPDAIIDYLKPDNVKPETSKGQMATLQARVTDEEPETSVD